MPDKILFVADFFADQVKGGGELNDWELIDLLRTLGREVRLYNSNQLSPSVMREEIAAGSKFIVSNFANLSSDCIDLLSGESEYVI